MVEESFREFIAPVYAEEGVREFLKYVNPGSTRDRLNQGNYILLAIENECIAGAIEVHTNNHIALLFVRKDYHRQGIAKKLLDMAIEKCSRANARFNRIDVNSSPYAVPIYEKLGFVKTGPESVVNGIRFTPMAKSFNRNSN